MRVEVSATIWEMFDDVYFFLSNSGLMIYFVPSPAKLISLPFLRIQFIQWLRIAIVFEERRKLSVKNVNLLLAAEYKFCVEEIFAVHI